MALCEKTLKTRGNAFSGSPTPDGIFWIRHGYYNKGETDTDLTYSSELALIKRSGYLQSTVKSQKTLKSLFTVDCI